MREGAKIIPFVFDGRQVRTVLINGVPWIVWSKPRLICPLELGINLQIKVHVFVKVS
jgi:hypothetical protein